jgi:hypothetical protein
MANSDFFEGREPFLIDSLISSRGSDLHQNLLLHAPIISPATLSGLPLLWIPGFIFPLNCRAVGDRIEGALIDSSQPTFVRRLHNAACRCRFAGVRMSPCSCRFGVYLQCHWQIKCSTSPNTFPRLSLLSSVNVRVTARCSAAESSIKTYLILHSRPRSLIQ